MSVVRFFKPENRLAKILRTVIIDDKIRSFVVARELAPTGEGRIHLFECQVAIFAHLSDQLRDVNVVEIPVGDSE